MEKGMSSKLETLSWGAAVAGTALAFFFGVQSSNANKKLTELQEALLKLEQSSASFDAGFDNGNLVLISDSSSFVEPDEVTVTPVFTSFNGSPIMGEQVAFPINSGLTAVDERTITFDNIEGRICAYRGNKELCSSPQSSLETIIVTMIVNGRVDTDPVQFSF